MENGRCITHVAEERLPFAPFRDTAPRAGDPAILAQALQKLATAVPQAHWPLQISLPDPAAIFQVMEFDSLPKAASEREAIARFRMERELPAVAGMESSFQVLGEDNGKTLLLSLAVPCGWLDCLREGCRAAGFVPSVTDIGASHLFNRFQDAFAAGEDGVLVSIEADSWAVLFWDQGGRPRFFRSRWRELDREDGADHESMAQEVERLVRAYVLSSPGRRIGRVYLCSGLAEHDSFAARLNARMQVPCVQLDLADGFYVTAGVSKRDVSLGTLAATIPRS
ncbi:MAG TPA: hypothetical protein VFP33_02035 [Gallionella sp.]|nr:hypothetical protein [Gallionella sp.]